MTTGSFAKPLFECSERFLIPRMVQHGEYDSPEPFPERALWAEPVPKRFRDHSRIIAKHTTAPRTQNQRPTAMIGGQSEHFRTTFLERAGNFIKTIRLILLNGPGVGCCAGDKIDPVDGFEQRPVVGAQDWTARRIDHVIRIERCMMFTMKLVVRRAVIQTGI